jgi:hypothetical protein
MVVNSSGVASFGAGELEEMLEIGRYLGSGLRYLLYYYGQLAITNEPGLAGWPEGPKTVIATIKAEECLSGLSPAGKGYLLAKLHSLEGIREIQSRQANQIRCRHDFLETRHKSGAEKAENSLDNYMRIVDNKIES